MAPSKGWMKFSRDGHFTNGYEVGVEKFIKYAFKRTRYRDTIKCPYVRCCNSSFATESTIQDHLIAFRIMQGYTFWYHHGERVGEAQSNIESEREEDEDDEEFLGDSGEGEDETSELIRDCYPNSHFL